LQRSQAVAVLVNLCLRELPVAYVFLGEYVIYLCRLVVEVHPFLWVVLHELAALRLLRDDEEGAYLGVLPL